MREHYEPMPERNEVADCALAVFIGLFFAFFLFFFL